jgi:hypothetical protein
VLALALFAVAGISRFVIWKAKIVDESQQMRLSLVAMGLVVILLGVVAARVSMRYPFGRVVADTLAAGGAGGLLYVLVGPFLSGSSPFAGGLGSFVGQFLLFLGLAAVGVGVGFMVVTALGKDWKSRGLRHYEEAYGRRPRRTA